MDKFLGKVVAITSIDGHWARFKGSEGWLVLFSDIEGKVIEDAVKKVVRQAEINEWIEVVKLDRRHNPVVEIGDILLIDHMTFGKPATAKGNNFEQSEYVVLENYTPPTPDPKVETKSEPSIKPLIRLDKRNGT